LLDLSGLIAYDIHDWTSDVVDIILGGELAIHLGDVDLTEILCKSS
jgi:hypothetical protein